MTVLEHLKLFISCGLKCLENSKTTFIVQNAMGIFSVEHVAWLKSAVEFLFMSLFCHL